MDTQKKVTLHQGSTLQDGRYTIVRVLGQGGFGITYQAMTTEKVTGKLGEMEVEVPVAIKEFFMKDTCLRDSKLATVLTACVPCSRCWSARAGTILCVLWRAHLQPLSERASLTPW